MANALNTSLATPKRISLPQIIHSSPTLHQTEHTICDSVWTALVRYIYQCTYKHQANIDVKAQQRSTTKKLEKLIASAATVSATKATAKAIGCEPPITRTELGKLIRSEILQNDKQKQKI